MDDVCLLISARKGDDTAFLNLYDRYRIPIFRFAYRLMPSVTAAEDITQECFLAVLKGTGFDAGRGSLRTYFFGMVRNLAVKRLRQMARETEELTEVPGLPDPLSDLISDERKFLVERAVRALPPLQREALILFEYEEFSLEEIAVITSADLGAVKARLHRARESLRVSLGPLVGRNRGGIAHG